MNLQALPSLCLQVRLQLHWQHSGRAFKVQVLKSRPHSRVLSRSGGNFAYKTITVPGDLSTSSTENFRIYYIKLRIIIRRSRMPISVIEIYDLSNSGKYRLSTTSSRVYQSKLSPLEDHCPSLDSTTSMPIFRCRFPASRESGPSLNHWHDDHALAFLRILGNLSEIAGVRAGRRPPDASGSRRRARGSTGIPFKFRVPAGKLGTSGDGPGGARRRGSVPDPGPVNY
jgi:hypothetical protein